MQNANIIKFSHQLDGPPRIYFHYGHKRSPTPQSVFTLFSVYAIGDEIDMTDSRANI